MSECCNFEIVFQLVLAVFLGGLVGLEREYLRKEAGLRTCSLVCLAATLFTIVALEISVSFMGSPGVNFDPARIIGQIVLGVGFLGAGLIIYRQSRVEGLTTAAALWVVAAVGATIGAKFYFLAIFATFLSVAILSIFRLFEERLLGTKKPEETDEK